VAELHTILGSDGYVDSSSAFNYPQCKPEEPGPTIKKILEYLISSTKHGDPDTCLMFVPKTSN